MMDQDQIGAQAEALQAQHVADVPEDQQHQVDLEGDMMEDIVAVEVPRLNHHPHHPPPPSSQPRSLSVTSDRRAAAPPRLTVFPGRVVSETERGGGQTSSVQERGALGEGAGGNELNETVGSSV